MKATKRILSSLRLANSLYSNRLITTHSLHHKVTHFSLSSQPHNSTFVQTHQNLLFSSKPLPIVDLVLSEDWSKLLEQELSKSNPKLTYENVIYILKKLDKDPLKSFKFFTWVTEKNGFKPCSAVYGLVLRILAKEESMEQFWDTVTKMKGQGFYIDEDTYRTILMDFKSLKMANDATALTHFYNRMIQENSVDSLVKEIVESVTGSDWGHQVEERLMEMKISVCDDLVVRVLKELCQCPLQALKIFRWLAQGWGFKHNSVTYNAVANALGRNDSIEEFWSMIKEMKSEGHDMDFDTYIKISRRFQKNKMLIDAVELYEHMMDGPYKPSVQDCSLLLRSISSNSNPDIDLVFRVVKKYEAMAHSLSKTIYDGIHRALTSVGRFDEAEKIMETMRNIGNEPDNVTYSQLIYGLGKSGRLEEACAVIDLMEANGCVPDLKTWTILIQAYCAAGEVDNALVYFAKMMEKNCDPDADLLDVLVNGFINQKKVDGAYKLLVELVSKSRLRPWQATYKNLIQYMLEEKNLEEALNLLKLMRKHDHPPFPKPFLKYISKFGTVEDAVEYLKALGSKEYPSFSTYQQVLKSFFREGRHSEAKDLLHKCPLHIRKHQASGFPFGSL